MSKFRFGEFLFNRLIIFFFCNVVIVDASACVKISDCVCSTKTRTIDFSILNGYGNKPRFSIPDPNPKVRPYVYHYNPCKAFIMTIPGCQNPDMTVVQTQPSYCYPLGSLSSLKYDGDPDKETLQIEYIHQDAPTIQRKVIVDVRCTRSPAFLEFVGENPQLTYTFKLSTNIVCPETNTNGLSTGSVLVIIFFLAVIIYFVGGILLLKFVRKAEGKEMVPNVSFWTDLPLLIRDGTFFVFRGCKVQTQYEKI